MAHFAKIENNVVTQVVVVSNDQEHRGQDFLAIDCELGGTWIQTSYNNNIRRKFASVGFIYDTVNDVFIEPQPYPSWNLDSEFNWQAPVPVPNKDKPYEWNESTQSWDEIIEPIVEPIAETK